MRKPLRWLARLSGAVSGGLVRFLRRIAIPKEWLLVYLALIVLPAGIILYGYYERSASILKNEVLRTMQQALKQAGSNLSYRLAHIEDISDAAFMNSNLHKYLSVGADDQSIGVQLEVVKDLRFLVESVQSNPDVFRIRLFVNKSKIYADEKINFFSLESIKDKPWYADIIAGNGGVVWIGDYEETYLQDGRVRVISAARMLRDPDRYDQVSGVEMIDVKEKLVTDILSGLQFAPGTQIYLADAAGTIVYHPDASLVGTQVPPQVQEVLGSGPEGSRSVVLGAEDGEVLYTTLEPTGWKLVAQGTASQLSRRAAKLTQASGLTSLLEYTALFLFLPFVLLAFIVRGMNRRMKKVITTIRREGTDGLSDLPALTSDFLVLERSVDHLVLRVRTLVEEKYKAQLHEREAQLTALQAQINPHFLYNTLDTINWIAIGRGATDISQMIDSLAKYFRLSLNKGQSIVGARDELRLAEVYLEIQQSRFPDTFGFRLDVEPGLDACRMPKLILQPIVENALLHGIRKTKGKRGTIVISARAEDGDLVFAVSDDGIGMDEAQARRLLAEAPTDAKPDGTGSSYGLYNVNERIRLYAGDGYGLTIVSAPGVGTTVTVRLRAEDGGGGA
ncbi:cache domain-containing sensor histidine kinase [Cohnella rhizosphaerae]|uniref:histidine kinase n=1 Tax=Cohnella rhizosphaerae TaxID=1457232 RepID=A0A9X4QVE6_9BACL|nr:sensor histidine kinase [Cohnella rhizosphaerae]MDG0811407.1 sensor histidine kinase [Cohnella rhizosphaerae]